MTKRLPAWLDWRIPAALAAALAVTAVGLFLVHNDHRSVTRITRITVRPSPHVVTPPSSVWLVPPLRAQRPTPKATPPRSPHRPTPAPTATPTASCLPLPIGVCIHAR